VFSDPEGLGLELVVDHGEDQPLIAEKEDIDGRLAIRGLHAVRAYGRDSARQTQVLGDVLGLEPESYGCWLARGEHRHGRVVFDAPPNGVGALGAGALHHVAFTIRDDARDAWREHLASAGLRPRRCSIDECSSRSTSANRAACCSSSPPWGRVSCSSRETALASRSC
jgi:hypothetical protein